MTSSVKIFQPPQREMFGNPDEWEIHFYAYPPYALIARPITQKYFHAHKGTRDSIHYQHITDDKMVAATIHALKDAHIVHEGNRVRDTRVLIEFTHKHRAEQIVLQGEGIVPILQAERKSGGKTEETVYFGISWENFHLLTQSHFRQPKG